MKPWMIAAIVLIILFITLLILSVIIHFLTEVLYKFITYLVNLRKRKV